MAGQTVIEVRDAVRTFTSGIETIRAVDGVSLSLEPTTMVCLYGPSGSGKSTLLNLIAGLDVPDSGIVHVLGIDVGSATEMQRANLRLKSVGVVFQDHNLVPEFTAADNLIIPLMASGLHLDAAREAALQALDMVHIRDLADRRPAQMSGGQRQRVGIARALSGERRVLVADEPTGSLDSATSRSLFELLRSLCHEPATTALVATHDPLARDCADVVLTMVDGKLQQS